MPIVVLLPAFCRHLQLLSSTLKSKLKPGLVLLHPFMDSTTNRVMNPTQREVDWQPWFPPKHRVLKRLSCRLVGGGIIRVEHLCQTRMPVPFSRRWKSLQEIVEGSVETLTLTIAGRVVWGCTRFFNPVKNAKLPNQKTFKVSALVRVNPCRNPKLVEPLRNQYQSHRGGPLIPRKEGQGVLAKHISHD